MSLPGHIQVIELPNGKLVYRVYTLGGHFETSSRQEAEARARAYYYARLPRGFMPASLRKAGAA